MSSIPAAKLRWFAVGFLLAVSVASIVACGPKSSDTDPTPVLSGPPNTTFPMPPLKADSEMGWALANGERAKLSDYRGKVLVLDFYATWCAPCRASIPQLIALQQQFGPAGLELIGLNVGGPDDRIKVAAFARELNIPYPLGFPDKALTDLFLSDDQTIPQTFVFGRDGQLAKRFIGYEASTGVELDKVITEAVNRKQ
ncbi:MAG: TlpA family protein disulfide reductase [Pyrinomonadaceae bacterium]|nr:TlpA family protein disulfide reductase [Pyrinomonadaceae bacterium]